MTDSSFPLVRTRVAPSPTGELHIGTLSIVLKNYAFAKKHGGQFILRIEDTDKVREVPGGIQNILNSISAYGLTWDEGPDKSGPYEPYIQSLRLPVYRQYAEQLIKSGHAYYCFCSKERLETVKQEMQARHLPPKYDGHCRNLPQDEVENRKTNGEPFVIRLKVPQGQVSSFQDWIRGHIEFATDTVDDQVLLKSDGYPTYHLGVVIDDHLMKISHVLRGEEWISSTPKHILLYQAFGWDVPIFAHIPIYLNPDGKGKMSKRSGTVSAQSFLDKGYLPEAILNFLMILGWTPQDQREILTLEEYIQEFDPRDMSKKSVVFEIKKLLWMNGQYIRSLSPADLQHKLMPFLPADIDVSLLPQLIPLVQERIETLADFYPSVEFFFKDPVLHRDKIVGTSDPSFIKQALNETQIKLQSMVEWTAESLEKELRLLLASHAWKAKDYFMLLRKVISGSTISPPLFESLAVLGKSKTDTRIQTALVSLTD